MTEPGRRNDMGGTVNGSVLQASTVTAHTIIMQPSGRPPAATPHQLPPLHPVWANRGRELAALDELAATPTPTWVLLTELAGTGKTQLAVHWLARKRARHPDGELYADLSPWPDQPPTTSHQVLARRLRALGVAPEELTADLA